MLGFGWSAFGFTAFGFVGTFQMVGLVSRRWFGFSLEFVCCDEYVEIL